MSLKSDLTIDASKFDRNLIDQKTQEFNQKLNQLSESTPKWYEIGAPEYRKLRAEGKTAFPKPTVLPDGINGTIPSRDSGRTIPYRMFKPENGEPKGVLLHIHGGGWVLQSEASQDPYLKNMADTYGLIVCSVGYRLAPEDPWPAGVNDCYDAAEWLVDNAEKEYAVPLMFACGESAGGHLTSLVGINLLETRPDFKFRGLILHFGCYELSRFLPHVHHQEGEIIIDLHVMQSYIKALFPNTTEEERRDPSISPFYKDFRGLELPPALFTCGSEDPLLDDTVFLGSKWAMWGNESVVKIYNGAPHGFIFFPREIMKAAGEALDDTATFVQEKMAIKS